MPPDLTSPEVKEEGNLLIEAVSLLVQRQRETETWVAEQVWQAEERAAATERRYADLEARLAGIEENLTRLTTDIAPRGDPAVDERLARLREQVDGLKSVSDARPAWPEGGPPPVPESPAPPPPAPSAHGSAPPPPAPARSAPPPAPAYPPSPAPVYAAAPAAREPEPAPAVAAAPPPARRATQTSGGFLEMLGPTPQDRFGFLLIGVGAIAILYTLLTQVHLS